MRAIADNKYWYILASKEIAQNRELVMRSFVLACIAAVVLAIVGAVVLNVFQKPVTVAFSTEGARP